MLFYFAPSPQQIDENFVCNFFLWENEQEMLEGFKKVLLFLTNELFILKIYWNFTKWR